MKTQPKHGKPKTKDLRPVTARRPNQPPWVPVGKELLFVPPEVQQAAANVIEPIYRELVVEARDPLERSVGISIAHILWLEILSQVDIKREYTQVEAAVGIAHDRQNMIDAQLRLIDSKIRAGYYLMRVREFRRRLAASPVPPPPIPSIVQAEPAPAPALGDERREATEEIPTL